MVKTKERDKIRRSNRATIRAEIENYHKSKEYIAAYDAHKEVSIAAIDYSADRVQYTPELTQPEFMAERRLHDIMAESRRRVQAIEWMLNKIEELPNADELRAFIEDKYWRKAYTITGLAGKYHVSERTIKNWDMKIVRYVAMSLGWEV